MWRTPLGDESRGHRHRAIGSAPHRLTPRGDTVYTSELELWVRYDELRRQADRSRLARQAVEGAKDTARSGSDEPEGRVRAARARRGRVRRATA
ncbi:hypothetical protein SNOUR_14110 [Streptomyces noursei ATCC 11455]|nr:hypothetical protein SNOUR_14110 [Streptomyces noursei ATCC 11455]